MKVDIFVTTKGRTELALKSLKSLYDNTPRDLYRLTVISDECPQIIPDPHVLNLYSGKYDHLLMHGSNLGLGPSINQALSHIWVLNQYFGQSIPGFTSPIKSSFICYCQDDLLYSQGWLEKLIDSFSRLEDQLKLGFASGVECVEFPPKMDLGNGMLLKDVIRAAQMFARAEYWMSMFPIPPFNLETGRFRAKPNDGWGSGVDWHFIRNHANSVQKTGRMCLVIPGLIKHLGYNESTWLDRELPESDSDKEEISKVK
jgi:hypothetical protein